MTEWRDIPGYEGRYQASDTGQIKSVARSYINKRGARRSFPDRILKGADGGERYINVVLFKDADTPVSCKVHQLVCRAFHGLRPFPGAEIRHLDGDPKNNRADNLRWGTRAENAQDTLRHGRNHNAARSHCGNGHEFSAENTTIYITPAGYRVRRCKQCRRRWGRERHQRRLLASVAS